MIQQNSGYHKNNYAFIDSQNVYLAVKSLDWKIDWKKFRIYINEHYGIKRAYLFIGYIYSNASFYKYLQEVGYICIFKPVLEYKDGTIKGNVDTDLVLQAMIEFPNFDKALIVTGDGDFYCLVRYLLQNQKLLKVLVPNRMRYSALLKRAAEKHIVSMNDLMVKIAQK